MASTETVLIGLTAILVLGIGIQWLAWRIRLPSILLLLLAGLLAGPVTGRLNPDALFGDLLLPIVSISVGLILFEGGLSLRIRELREVGSTVVGLISIGVMVTWLLASTGAWLLLDFSPGEAVLLGAILVVTGPTVIGPLLRQIRPVGRVGPVAKWEGIVIDPVGAVLAVLVFRAIETTQAVGFYGAVGEAAVHLAGTVAVGVLAAVVAGGLVLVCLRRHWIPDFLESSVLLMVVVATFTASNLVEHESGLLAVTLLGIVLANQKWVSIEHLVEFKENLRVLLISSLFIVLAARIPQTAAAELNWQAFVFVGLLIFVVRPVAVALATIRSGLGWKERVFLSWMAPRGIVAASVASVFSLQLHEPNESLVTMTFLVILVTVLVYGLGAPLLARRLGLAVANPQGLVIAGAHSLARSIAKTLGELDFAVLLVDLNRSNIHAARLEGLKTCYGSILSERVVDEMDLGGMGRFLAMTPNNEVNSLATRWFATVFDRASIYQLALPRPQGARAETAPRHLPGRLLFDASATYGALQSRLAWGAVITKTRLTEKFDYEAFQELHGQQALPLFVVRENGTLAICTAEDQLVPKSGETVISIVDAEPT
ncbi:MAG: cation:proton antiporter [Pirellulales bacterium]|nr:cation:proton antiporter [Pirellulales bacterium]